MCLSYASGVTLTAALPSLPIMVRLLFLAVVLSAVVVVCAALTRRGHNVSEATSMVNELFSEPARLMKMVEEIADLAAKEDVREETARTKVKEVEEAKDEMQRNKDGVEVSEGELEWKERELLSLDVTSFGAALASLRHFLHHARRLRCGTLTLCLSMLPADIE